MPRHFLPKKSGEHRIACFALYRALLEQCPRLQSLVDTLPGQPNQLQHIVRKQFRRNRHETSHRLVVIALKKGYEAEELLRTAGDGDSTAQTKVKEILLKLEEEREKSRTANAGSSIVPREKPRMWPYPGATSTILKRPLPAEKLSGRRHIPVMTSANVLPLLRIKKPQPEFLSRVIRNKIEQRQRRNNNMSKIDEEYSWAAKEDAWDKLVADTSDERGVKGWRDVLVVSREKIERKLAMEQREASNTAWKLLSITKQEKELRAKEKREQLMSQRRDARGQKLGSGDRPVKSATTLAQRDDRDQAGTGISRLETEIDHSFGKEAFLLHQELNREDYPVKGRTLSIKAALTRDLPSRQLNIRHQPPWSRESHQETASTRDLPPRQLNIRHQPPWKRESLREEAPNSSNKQTVRRAVRRAPIWRSKPNS